MAMERKVAEFELTTSTGREAYRRLVNQPGVHIINENDFFGSEGSKEEGFSSLIIRIVDYWDNDDADDPVYKKPIS